MLTLLAVVQRQVRKIQKRRGKIQRLRRMTWRPRIKPSWLLQPPPQPKPPKERPGLENRSETKTLKIDETIVLVRDELPPDARLKGYRDYLVQDLIFPTQQCNVI